MSHSAKRKLKVGAVLAVCAMVLYGGYLSITQNQRHVSGLIDMTYEYTGLDVQPSKLAYGKRTWDACGDNIGTDKAWIGFQAGELQQQVEDMNLGAEPLASRLEAEGWTVQRYRALIRTDDDDLERRYVHALKGNSRISALFSPSSISTSARSGPCVSVFGFQDPPESELAVPIDVFPE